LNVIPDIIGAVGVEHGFESESKPEKEGFLGSRITVLARPRQPIDKVEMALAGTLNHRLWRWMTINDAERLTNNPRSLQIIERLIQGQSVSLIAV